MENPHDEQIREILKNTKTIAVVGLSDNPERPSYEVASYLKSVGYKIFPVNPTIDEVLGERSYKALEEIPEKVDLVDLFRASNRVAPFVDAAIAIGAKVVWMQEGVINEDAAQKAREAGLTVVMDRCTLKEHRRLLRHSGRV